MSTTTATCWESVDAAIDAGAETAFSFLERLVAEPSTVGQERGAQEIVADELAILGFGVSCLEIPAETAAGAPGGVAQAPYPGRPNVLGRINPGTSPSLLLNGHIDVVPAKAAVWSSEPFTPVRSDGWLSGRGAGDMKAGFAMGLLAIRALREALPEAVSGELAFLSVIEEECTGNGTLAGRGLRADGTEHPCGRRGRGARQHRARRPDAGPVHQQVLRLRRAAQRRAACQ